MKRVKTNAGRPGWRAKGLSFLITFLIVLLPVLTCAREPEDKRDTGDGRRITKEITLKGGECAIVHFGLFDSCAQARIAGARYMARGAAGYVYEGEDGFYAAGCLFESAEEAEKMRSALTREGIECGYAVLNAQDGVIRVTASGDTIDLIEKAYAACESAEAELMRISRHLDAGNIECTQAQALLSVLRYDLKGLSQKTENAAEEASGVGKRLFLLMNQSLECAKTFPKEDSENEMRLSARLKYAALEMRIQRYRFLDSLQ